MNNLQQPRSRKTRIVATLGPSSCTLTAIKALFASGADVFRLNMSHGAPEEKAELIEYIRTVEKDTGRPISIIADLQGPKLRIGQFKAGSCKLEAGNLFTLDKDPRPGDQNRCCLPHPEIFEALKSGDDILLDDGKIRLQVQETSTSAVHCNVLIGGILSDRKGVNIPNRMLPIAALTHKDRRDLTFVLSQDVDWIALSFVQRPEDLMEARQIIGTRAGLIAKIEKPAAVAHLEKIIAASDAVMVARGDLGVEVSVEEVPALQKKIIREARRSGKPVIVATQMLESMIHSPVPTRAEVSDVANAVYEGVDAVMLSAESAAGDFPVEAVRVMDRVSHQIEEELSLKYACHQERKNAIRSSSECAITAVAGQATRLTRAASIVTFTKSGSTAVRASGERPAVPILALTPNLSVARKLCLVWGLHMVTTPDVNHFEEMIGKAKSMALHHGVAHPGDHIVITAGVPFGCPGTTNVLHIAQVNGTPD